MGSKRLTMPAIFAALKRRLRLRRAAKAPTPLSDQAITDVYWILRLGVGVALEERIEHYREHLIQRGAEAALVEARLAAIRPFLHAAHGEDVARDEDDSERRSGVGLIGRRSSSGFALRYSTGVTQMLTSTANLSNDKADGLQHGDAALVWIDEEGRASPLDVLVQEFDGFDLNEEGEP
jgi:hypothetical protein